MCFVFVWEQTAAFAIYIKKIDWFYTRDEKCLQRSTDWAFKWSSLCSIFYLFCLFIYLFIY
jgi:hypothetical protein